MTDVTSDIAGTQLVDRTDDVHPGEPPDESARSSDRGPGRRPRRLRRVVLCLLLCLTLLGSAALAALIYVEQRVDGNLERVPAFTGLEDRPERPAGSAGDAVNVLLMGTDRRSEVPTTGGGAAAEAWVPGAQRTDTLMLLHIDADRKGASVVSLPRDSWVTVPGHGRAKINAAFSLGGPPLAVATVERLTGIRIDHVAIIDWAGFAALTDAVGGVEVTIPTASYDGYRQIRWEAGRRVLTGEEALAYVGQRAGLPGGDLDRVRRQQAFLRTLAGTTVRTAMREGPGSVLGLVDLITRHVTVDEGWTVLQMGRLALSLRDLRPPDIAYLTAPVTGTGRVGDQSVVHLDRQGGAELWAEMRADRMDRWAAAHGPELTGDVVR